MRALLIVVPVIALLVPLVTWFLDESRGRPGWVKLTQVSEPLRLGDGAFRSAQVEGSHTEVLRTRAPWSVRLVALSCYLPLGVAILAALPWMLGLLFFRSRTLMHGSDVHIAGLLIAVFPVGCWAAARMWRLGRALLNLDYARFYDTLPSTVMLQRCLNVAIFFAGSAIALSSHRQEALLLLVAPTLTLAQVAAVVVVGRRHLQPEAAALDETPSTAVAPP